MLSWRGIWDLLIPKRWSFWIRSALRPARFAGYAGHGSASHQPGEELRVAKSDVPCGRGVMFNPRNMNVSLCDRFVTAKCLSDV